MHAFILAGGFATRLWPLTERRAKPLLPLAGEPIINHLLRHLSWEIPITISVNATFEASFHKWKEREHRTNIEIVIEESKRDDQKLGALGAVGQWITHHGITDDILLLTGDNYCGFSFHDFLSHFTAGTPLIAAHNIGDLEKAKSFGTIIPAPDSKTVEAFEEKPLKPRSTLVSTGCSVIPAPLLPTLVEFARERPDNLGGIFEEFLRRGIPVEFRAYTDLWFDIGSFEAYLEANRALVGDKLLLGKDATSERTDTHGTVVLGQRSVVRDSTLSNVVLFENCTVEDCVLEDCILDDHCTLKGIDLNGQMLREGTVLTRK
ncbi:MAG: NDP-sugar synthase [Candidatus Peribacteraceae bacterium]|nr:NDP-sugar synthase [Candidatus Peribacteraceae bacterium]MDD5075079.1 NDP-sugar synthase [Candidatus Peribacteraceae bacterium]